MGLLFELLALDLGKARLGYGTAYVAANREGHFRLAALKLLNPKGFPCAVLAAKAIICASPTACRIFAPAYCLEGVGA
jgi:hypothetical protein